MRTLVAGGWVGTVMIKKNVCIDELHERTEGQADRPINKACI